MTTLRFTDRNRDQDPLLAQAAELPKDIAPAHDLWPGVHARLDEAPRQRRSFGWPMALAAGVVAATVSALLTWGLMREPAPQAPQLAGDPTPPAEFVPVSYGTNSAIGAEQLAARDELLLQFRRKLDRLSPQTREAVVANLTVIQRAADEIDAALAQDPASGLLNELLVGAYRQELQLYSKVVTTGGDTMRRT
ncbi:MAG TPA: hypothetical protein VML92_07765 [Steroidobacteraceae bacterium]|nr:hypothetical protein [Steroidobacteraceae bacterium]